MARQSATASRWLPKGQRSMSISTSCSRCTLAPRQRHVTVVSTAAALSCAKMVPCVAFCRCRASSVSSFAWSAARARRSACTRAPKSSACAASRASKATRISSYIPTSTGASLAIKSSQKPGHVGEEQQRLIEALHEADQVKRAQKPVQEGDSLLGRSPRARPLTASRVKLRKDATPQPAELHANARVLSPGRVERVEDERCLQVGRRPLEHVAAILTRIPLLPPPHRPSVEGGVEAERAAHSGEEDELAAAPGCKLCKR
eukprot:6201124-Pleurochrysis_carterae.AAC.2